MVKETEKKEPNMSEMFDRERAQRLIIRVKEIAYKAAAIGVVTLIRWRIKKYGLDVVMNDLNAHIVKEMDKTKEVVDTKLEIIWGDLLTIIDEFSESPEKEK